MILFLHGPDTFRSRQYLHESIQKFKIQRDPQGYNVVFVDGKKDEAGKILMEINSAPFLAERRMIVIENILSSSDKELLGELIERIKTQKFPDSNIIIFWQGEAFSKIKEAKELQALLTKEKYAPEFITLKGAELARWAAKEIKARGGVIEPPALDFLCQNVGADMWGLNSLIDQLVAYTSKLEIRPITLADVQLFLDEKVDDNIFNMVEAVVNGNKKLAFKLLAEQRRLGEEDSKIFGLIVWQFRILLEMADLLEREPKAISETIAKELGIHPFVAKKNLAAARRLPLSALQKIYRDLLEIDIKTKTGQGDQSLLTDMFIGRT